MMDILVMIWII